MHRFYSFLTVNLHFSTPQGLALQQQRGFAEKAVAAQIDWDAVSSLVHSDEGKRELASLRSTFMDIQQRLQTMSKDAPPPNWAEWSKELDPKIVDGFKKAYESEFYFPTVTATIPPLPFLRPTFLILHYVILYFTKLKSTPHSTRCCSNEAPHVSR